MNPTDYATYYHHVVRAIRSVNATIPIGGPATSIPRTDYLDVLHANTNILQSWVNFVSWHEYNAGVYNDTSMQSRGQSYWPGIRGYLSEWNYNTDCDDNSSDYDNDDPNNVPRFAARVISTIANGEGEEYFDTDSATSCAAFDTNGNLLPKIYNWYLMSTAWSWSGSSVGQVHEQKWANASGRGGQFGGQASGYSHQPLQLLLHSCDQFSEFELVGRRQPANLLGGPWFQPGAKPN